jgi:hypothetical protein
VESKIKNTVYDIFICFYLLSVDDYLNVIESDKGENGVTMAQVQTLDFGTNKLRVLVSYIIEFYFFEQFCFVIGLTPSPNWMLGYPKDSEFQITGNNGALKAIKINIIHCSVHFICAK